LQEDSRGRRATGSLGHPGAPVGPGGSQPREHAPHALSAEHRAQQKGYVSRASCRSPPPAANHCPPQADPSCFARLGAQDGRAAESARADVPLARWRDVVTLQGSTYVGGPLCHRAWRGRSAGEWRRGLRVTRGGSAFSRRHSFPNKSRTAVRNSGQFRTRSPSDWTKAISPVGTIKQSTTVVSPV